MQTLRSESDPAREAPHLSSPNPANSSHSPSLSPINDQPAAPPHPPLYLTSEHFRQATCTSLFSSFVLQARRAAAAAARFLFCCVVCFCCYCLSGPGLDRLPDPTKLLQASFSFFRFRFRMKADLGSLLFAPILSPSLGLMVF